MSNPLVTLDYESVFERLGEDYYDPVPAAQFPSHQLRWRNDDLLQQLGLNAASVDDRHFIEAFGQFQGREFFLAMRYHGYQFGEYNSALGDGRGFLYGQLRDRDGQLYDLGTKGSGTTPYSRGGDGRLTLKGGVREVLAAEMLHRLGVKTSRCLSLIETGEHLWRGDEPSPTRSSVMVRVQQSHIRFGSFERLHFYDRRDLIATLLDHVIETYYGHLLPERDRYAGFYAELVQRVAELCAQWMAAGFCHGVLNTDNMAITGESFDYGPYAFIPTLDPRFTAAYFDYAGRYCYANQPAICRWNLEMLQQPLQQVIAQADLAAGLAQYDAHYHQHYRALMLEKLGFPGDWDEPVAEELLRSTLEFLQRSQVGYPDFFWQLTQQLSPSWRQDAQQILVTWPIVTNLDEDGTTLFAQWQRWYHQVLTAFPETALDAIRQRLIQRNPATVILRPEIEAIWQPIVETNNWQPFQDLLQNIRA
jgi:uncharacterized protein YdiU (UPF0061 family)